MQPWLNYLWLYTSDLYRLYLNMLLIIRLWLVMYIYRICPNKPPTKKKKAIHIINREPLNPSTVSDVGRSGHWPRYLSLPHQQWGHGQWHPPLKPSLPRSSPAFPDPTRGLIALIYGSQTAFLFLGKQYLAHGLIHLMNGIIARDWAPPGCGTSWVTLAGLRASWKCGLVIYSD